MHEMCQKESRELALFYRAGRRGSGLLSIRYGSLCIPRHPAEAAVDYLNCSHVENAVTAGRQVSDRGRQFCQHRRSVRSSQSKFRAINNSPVVPLTRTLASALLRLRSGSPVATRVLRGRAVEDGDEETILRFSALSLKPNKEELIAITRIKEMALRGFADSRLHLLCSSRFC